MEFINSHLQLLKGLMFDKVEDRGDFIIAQSFIKQEKDWNQLIPLLPLDTINSAEIDLFIDEVEADGWYFSYYLQQELVESYKDMLAKTGYSFLLADTYISREIDAELPVELNEDETFTEVGADDLEQYAHLDKEVFAGWDNAEAYTRRFYSYGQVKDGKQLRNFMIKKGGDIVTFGSVIYSPELNMAYLHNSGTSTKYQRQGYFSKLKCLMLNYLLSQGITKVYTIVEEGGNSQKALYKLGFEFLDRYQIYSNKA